MDKIIVDAMKPVEEAIKLIINDRNNLLKENKILRHENSDISWQLLEIKQKIEALIKKSKNISNQEWEYEFNLTQELTQILNKKD